MTTRDDQDLVGDTKRVTFPPILIPAAVSAKNGVVRTRKRLRDRCAM